MGNVGIASCAHFAWIDSSRIMVDTLAHAVEKGGQARLHTPIDKNGLIACLKDSEFFIMHTHGSAVGFYDQRADDSQTAIATIEDIKNFPQFPELRLVVITACEAAGGEQDYNVAAALSTRIAKDGLVIANRYSVYGASHDFGEKEGKSGWVAYQNGKVVISEEYIPAFITMETAYLIYKNFVNRSK